MIEPSRPGIEEFILARLSFGCVPGLPEIGLYRQHPRSGLARFIGEDGRKPYWAYGWAGGSVLSRHILDHPDIVCGRRIVDIGSGSGVVAIAAAKAGARAVLAVDIDPLAVAAARLNAHANGVVIDLVVADAFACPVPDADLVTVGDLSYEARLARRLETFLDRCLEAGREILVGDPGRAHLQMHRLTELARYDVEDFGQAAPVSAAVYGYGPVPPLVPAI